MTASYEISGHGIAKRNFNNLCTILIKNGFLEIVDKKKKHLESKFGSSTEAVALINCPSFLQRNFITATGRRIY